MAPNIAKEVAEVIGVEVLATHALVLPRKDLTSEVVPGGTKSTARTIEGTLISDTSDVKAKRDESGACSTGLNRLGATIFGERKTGTTLGYTYSLGKAGTALCLGISIHEVAK